MPPRGRGRGKTNQQEEMAEMQRMIEDLTLAVQALRRQEPAEAQVEIPEGNHNLLKNDNPEEDDEVEDEVEDENPFHDAKALNWRARGGLEDGLLNAVDLNGGIKIEVADFYGKTHAEDYSDWEANLKNYLSGIQWQNQEKCDL